MIESQFPGGREFTDEECASRVSVDYSRKPQDLLTEIYKEATNENQKADARIAKTLAKCSTLLAQLANRQERVHRAIKGLTWAVLIFTVLLVALTVKLTYYTAKLIKHEQESNQHADQTGTNAVEAPQPPR